MSRKNHSRGVLASPCLRRMLQPPASLLNLRGSLMVCFVIFSMAVPAFGAQARGVGKAVGDSPATKYAIIIGINRYEDQGIGDLSYAVSDARAVYAALTGAPDGFDPSHTVLLADDVPDARPTRANILRFLSARLMQVGENDTVLVYFAGHGTTVKKEGSGKQKAEGRLYLLPCDAALSPLEETAVAYASVKGMLEASAARRKVLILDACHSGAGRALNRFSADIKKELESSGEGTFILASCGGEELSQERPELGHGAFTYFLLEGLQGGADADADGAIGVLELGEYTSRKTRDWAAFLGMVQTPWQILNFTDDIVLARPYAGALPAIAAGPVTRVNLPFVVAPPVALILFLLVLWRLVVSRGTSSQAVSSTAHARAFSEVSRDSTGIALRFVRTVRSCLAAPIKALIFLITGLTRRLAAFVKAFFLWIRNDKGLGLSAIWLMVCEVGLWQERGLPSPFQPLFLAGLACFLPISLFRFGQLILAAADMEQFDCQADLGRVLSRALKKGWTLLLIPLALALPACQPLMSNSHSNSIFGEAHSGGIYYFAIALCVPALLSVSFLIRCFLYCRYDGTDVRISAVKFRFPHWIPSLAALGFGAFFLLLTAAHVRYTPDLQQWALSRDLHDSHPEDLMIAPMGILVLSGFVCLVRGFFWVLGNTLYSTGQQLKALKNVVLRKRFPSVSVRKPSWLRPSGVSAHLLPHAKKTSGQPRPGDMQTVDLGGGVTLELVWCPPGTFMMGSPESEAERSDDETQHQVTLSKGFWMGKYEVTQEQWKQVTENNPSSFKGDPRLPVETVSWEDCQKFIEKLNSRMRGGGFGLPTEAQWEYACRAGTTTPFHFGQTISTEQANYDGNYTYGNGRKGVYRKKTTVVGSFPSNAWGLYDMHRNVWEWCSDGYGVYPSGAVADPSGASSGKGRVLRGGSWFYNPRYCRSAYRDYSPPGNRSTSYGFRLLRTP